MILPRILRLDSTLINQIAAGEVIERPAAALKELVENAIDAGATRIDVVIRDGGRTFLQVSDNGLGMDRENLELCVERHATSKLPNGDLFDIKSLGFRGEALPSIGAVSRLNITTKIQNEEHGWQITIEGGAKSDITPIPHSVGTRVTVRDLFYATPARLKFLKSASTEYTHCCDFLKRLALSNPHVAISLKSEERDVFSYAAQSQEDRIRAILGVEFMQSACLVTAERTNEQLKLEGWISLPTYHRSQSTDQYLFINGRPVRDKVLSMAVRVGYQDVLAHSRYPVVVLFLTIDPTDVDVNVHPAKAEVRFRDSTAVRNFLIGALQQTIRQHSQTTSNHLASLAVATFKPSTSSYSPSSSGVAFNNSSPRYQQPSFTPSYRPAVVSSAAATLQSMPLIEREIEENPDMPLGFARAQIDKTYIISETIDSLVIVDQHAAHERLVYEKLKQQLITQGVQSQALLIPDVVEFNESEMLTIQKHLSDFEKLGFEVEIFGVNALLVRQVPAILGGCDVKQLMRDLVDDWSQVDQSLTVQEQIHELLATLACHNSIRAGKALSFSEMNAMLRQMEQTPYSAQCNHGRPTYIELKKTDIEKLFGRR